MSFLKIRGGDKFLLSESVVAWYPFFGIRDWFLRFVHLHNMKKSKTLRLRVGHTCKSWTVAIPAICAPCLPLNSNPVFTTSVLMLQCSVPRTAKSRIGYLLQDRHGADQETWIFDSSTLNRVPPMTFHSERCTEYAVPSMGAVPFRPFGRMSS